MNIYLSLFQASITLAGFIAVFLVFRYRQIDTYVDSKKDILRSLLIKDIKKNSYVEVEIQEIGKEYSDSYYVNLFSRFKKDKDTVTTFVNHILAYRKMRDKTVCLGLTSISIWALLAIISLISRYSFCIFSCYITAPYIIIGFIISMIFTLYFVCYSLRAKRPE
jgi:hypothetical protein